MLPRLLVSICITGVLAYAYTFSGWQAVPLVLTVLCAVVGVSALYLGDMDEGGSVLMLALVLALVTTLAGFI